MNQTLIVALVGLIGSVVAAALSYVFTKRQQLETQWRDSKLTHYRALLQAISDLAVDNSDADAHRRFASAINTIALGGPQAVVDALLAYHGGIASSQNGPRERHDQLLTQLVLAVRRDLDMRPKDNPGTFFYRLAGAPSQRSEKAIATPGRDATLR
jgi:hypothetical protein